MNLEWLQDNALTLVGWRSAPSDRSSGRIQPGFDVGLDRDLQFTSGYFGAARLHEYEVAEEVHIFVLSDFDEREDVSDKLYIARACEAASFPNVPAWLAGLYAGLRQGSDWSGAYPMGLQRNAYREGFALGNRAERYELWQVRGLQ